MRRPVPNIRLDLEAREQEPDGMGGHRHVWRRLGRLWAQMNPQNGRERNGQAGARSEVNWRIVVRACLPGDPCRPVPGQRLRLGQRMFHIRAVAEMDDSGRWLECYAAEETGI